MNLFDYMRSSTQEKESPLASRMRPTTLNEVVGQNILSERISCFTGRFRQISWAPLFLRAARNGKDHPGQSDCQYDKRQFSPD